jgi:hypothetical protein
VIICKNPKCLLALAKTESDIKKFTDKHNAYLKELGVDLLKSP